MLTLKHLRGYQRKTLPFALVNEMKQAELQSKRARVYCKLTVNRLVRHQGNIRHMEERADSQCKAC